MEEENRSGRKKRVEIESRLGAKKEKRKYFLSLIIKNLGKNIFKKNEK